MAINPLSGGAPSAMYGAGSAPKVSFKPPTSMRAPIAVVGHPMPPAPIEITRVVSQVQSAQARMEQVLALAQSGKHFSAAELLSLQTHVYRASQELDLAGKVVEKATGGVKQILQTQV